MLEADLGLVGCGVMGGNLALNMDKHGFFVAVHDTDKDKIRRYRSDIGAEKNIEDVGSVADLTAGLKRPRRILMMVPAGDAVDQCIEDLVPHLEAGDIIIDGGNSHYMDTRRRAEDLEAKGFQFVGMGISGGAEGALAGPSIMIGGSRAAWKHIKPIFEAISARTEDGSVCCGRVGDDGAGHFVKMVHNGIEYGEMQIICEAYHLMKEGLEMSLNEIADVFDMWNQGELCCYLLQIGHEVLNYRNAKGEAVVEQILDKAGQKGTGKWTVAATLDMAQPFTVAASALFVRFLSCLRPERAEASKLYGGASRKRYEGNAKNLVSDLGEALYASRIVNHAQGFALMRAASEQHGWGLELGKITCLWRAGCIIRSVLLDKIKAAFERDADLRNLLLDPFLATTIKSGLDAWRRTAGVAIDIGIPFPAITSALAYFDGYSAARLPVSLLQAMRDYFGAHGYERTDDDGGELFHTDWTV